MNKKLSTFIVGAFALAFSTPGANAQSQLFTSQSNDQPSYRIPSIVRYPGDKTGAVNGGLWAFADLRYKGGDIGNNNRIDIIARKLEEDATNWSDPTIILHGNDNATDYSFAYGDAATVVDRESGKILLMTAAGRNSVWVSTNGYPNVARSVYDPETGKWTTTEVSNQFYDANNGINHLFVSSGRIIQSTKYKKDKYYRIYAGICTVNSGGSRVAYSDDFGETWHYLGGPTAKPIPDGDECKVEELPDGSILFNSKKYAKEKGKTYYGRFTNVFTFTDIASGEGSWDNVVSSGASDIAGQTFTSYCNAEIMLVPAKKVADNSQTYLLLLSGPASTDRTHGCIYWKELPSTAAEYRKPSNYVSGWSKYQWSTTYCAYTTMALDNNGNIAMLDENNGIHYQNLSLSTITNDAYIFRRSAKGTYKTTAEPFEVQRPSFSLNGGVYSTDQTIKINKEKGTTVFYTLDGSDPIVSATTSDGTPSAPRRAEIAKDALVYSTPITITEGSTTLKAVAVDDYSGDVSKTVVASYFVTSSSDNTSTTPVSKNGTTISLDYKSSTALYTQGAQTIGIFGYLRHNGTHIQLVSSNKPDLSNSSEQDFKDMNNNLGWTDTDDKLLKLSNGLENGTTATQYAYFAIIAPYGYRFLNYDMVIGSGSLNGAILSEYKYAENSTKDISVVRSATASDKADVRFSRSLGQGTNVLYFKLDVLTPHKPAVSVILKSLKLTYAIDNAFSVNVPNAVGAKFHSGFINLGTFAQTDNNHLWGFAGSLSNKDYQEVKVVNSNGKALNIASVDGGNYFIASSKGNYYVEAPTKFRIVGATVNLKRGNGTILFNQSYTPSTSSNNDYIAFGSDSKYLMINSEGKGVNTTNKAEATCFKINYVENSGYTIVTPDNKYLYLISATSTDKATIRTSDEVKYWGLAKDNSGKDKLYYNVNNNKRYLICTDAGVWGDSWNVNNPAYPAIPKATSSGDFTANVYNRENTGVATDGEKNLSETETSQVVTLNNLNNDAIRINLSSLNDGQSALFNVDLKVLPLDPELASVEAAALVNVKKDDKTTETKVVGNSPVNSYNYVFNNGNTINVPVPSSVGKGDNITMVFRNAKNEEETMWYTTGSNQNIENIGGYSNVYLIGSTADADNGLSVSSPYPGARTSVDEVGVDKISPTNIADVAKGTASTLEDHTADATTAGYTTVTMTLNNPTSDKSKTEDKTTFYLYSADQPTFQIMPPAISLGKHIDFRFYTISVKPVVAETPKVDIVEIYKSTLKNKPHKVDGSSDGNVVDDKHTYVGVKISSQLNKDAASATLSNSLNASDIYEAIKTELKKNQYGFDENDLFRGVLYVDMSNLTTVTNNTFTESSSSNTEVNAIQALINNTADNCLLFMPKGFVTTGLNNVISKQDGDTYAAIGDVRIWDQQPFFTPYDFNTGTSKALYEREGTVAGENVKATVRNMAAVLPFSIALDGGGHPYLDGTDHPTSNITFYNVTGSGELTGVKKDHTDIKLTYGVRMQEVTTKMAEANKPYYVTIDKDQNPGFTFNIPGATFAKTGNVDVTADADGKKQAEIVTLQDANTNPKNTDETWTAYGNYWGEKKNAQDDDRKAAGTSLWYFSKDLFWRAENLTDYTDVNIRPFRAYYITNATTTASKAMAVFDDSEIVTTGIEDVNAAAKNNDKVYDLNGRYVGDSLENLAPGLYIQNGRKVVRQ